jgi:hypothetical protein
MEDAVPLNIRCLLDQSALATFIRYLRASTVAIVSISRMAVKMKGSNFIAGDAIEEVLPDLKGYWFQTAHLLQLNLILLVPLCPRPSPVMMVSSYALDIIWRMLIEVHCQAPL